MANSTEISKIDHLLANIWALLSRFLNTADWPIASQSQHDYDKLHCSSLNALHQRLAQKHRHIPIWKPRLSEDPCMNMYISEHFADILIDSFQIFYWPFSIKNILNSTQMLAGNKHFVYIPVVMEVKSLLLTTLVNDIWCSETNFSILKWDTMSFQTKHFHSS